MNPSLPFPGLLGLAWQLSTPASTVPLQALKSVTGATRSCEVSASQRWDLINKPGTPRTPEGAPPQSAGLDFQRALVLHRSHSWHTGPAAHWSLAWIMIATDLGVRVLAPVTECHTLGTY